MFEQSLRKNELRKKILALVAEYGELASAPAPFVAGTTAIPPSGKVVGTAEMQLMVEASLDAWLTTGRFNALFESRLAAWLGSEGRGSAAASAGESASRGAAATLAP